MNTPTPILEQPAIVYPESDGQPMAENTRQFRWIVTIKEGLDTYFRPRPDVFVAGDLFWYPVEGRPDIRTAPDALVVFGRPKGDRGSYRQWEEGGIAPQVVFEVLSPSNRPSDLREKLRFYEHYGVEEYYIYDPDDNRLEGYQRVSGRLREITRWDGWTSPRLGIRFEWTEGGLRVLRPDGRALETYEEVDLRAEAEHERAEEGHRLARAARLRADIEQRRADEERERAEVESRRAEAERQRAEAERQRAEAERQRAKRLEDRLRALGLDPESP